MGHTRLGTIPKSRKWVSVVGAIQASAEGTPQPAPGPDVAEVASRALDAAEAGLDRAINDPGLAYSVYLLTQLALASRDQNWLVQLRTLGIDLPSEPTPMDLATEFQRAVDDHLVEQHGYSDVSEMAQGAVGEVLVELISPSASTLFGNKAEDLQRSVRSLSTKGGFARLSQGVFGRFMARFLNFYLSRVTASQLGSGPLLQIGDLTQFNGLLEQHCNETARVVRDFAGEWYSKTEFTEGIDLENSKKFVAVCTQKLRAELKREQTER